MGKFSQEYLLAIMARFSVKEKPDQFIPINNGFINDTYLVMRKGMAEYILQRVNHNVFTDIDGLMSNVHLALQALQSEDYAGIDLICTTSQKTYLDDAEGYWRLMSFINDSTVHNTSSDPKIAFGAGRIIGKFHQLLQDVDREAYVDTIPNFHHLETRKQQFIAALEKAVPDKKEIAKEAIAFARGILAKSEAWDVGELPVRVCHNDTKLNNILFSKASGDALCLIDLDTLMKGHFLYDFGDAIRTIVNTADEDERELHKITFEKNLFEAFIDGLAANGSFLSKKEVDTLAYGAILMPFLHGLRALTDFLNNNIYYKISYENQNLDRCLSLFDFTQKALEQMDYMQSVISQKLA